MRALRIVLPEEPQAKGRSRVALVNGKFHSYTPERTKNAQDAIVARLKRYQDDCFPAGTPVKLTVTFYRTKSKYLPIRETLPFRKPDLDNLLKLLSDAMNGLLVVDDSQITTISAKKRWTDRAEGYIALRLEEDIL